MVSSWAFVYTARCTRDAGEIGDRLTRQVHNGILIPVSSGSPLSEPVRRSQRVSSGEGGARSLDSVCTGGLTRDSTRFEPAEQKRYLEAIDDPGPMQVDEDLPPPTAFPPFNR